MQTIEPIIIANLSESLVYRTKVSKLIKLMNLAGYSNDKLKNQRVFEVAFKDIINQVKYN